MKFVLMASAFLGLAAIPATAIAMPIAPLNDGPPGLTLVAMGCGPGWTRGPYGHCHPMGGPGPVVGVAPGPVVGVYAHPYGYGRHCWWRAGVRVCN
jgi:hypothetical protein